MPREPVRILVIDDHAVVRAGLATILNEQPDLRVVAQAANGDEALQSLRAQSVDVVLLDLTLGKESGWDVLRSMRRQASAPPVLGLSANGAAENAVQAMRSGAVGFLSKEMLADEVIRAVRRVAEGKRYISPDLADRLASLLIEGEDTLEPHERLTAREFDVMLRIARGQALTAIAEELHVSPKTVTTWRSRVLEKLGLENNADLTRYAVRCQLIAV